MTIVNRLFNIIYLTIEKLIYSFSIVRMLIVNGYDHRYILI